LNVPLLVSGQPFIGGLDAVEYLALQLLGIET
jgi:hypothetical protein